jgi:hypothetical protein
VCCDCYLARLRGTKYKSLGMMSKPYRTHKRFRPNLDVNLWPVCMEDRVHDLDRLIMTQMSPAQVIEEVVRDIHEIRDYYKLPAGCKCCQRASSEENRCITADPERNFSVDIFTHCKFCGTSFKHLSLTCKRLHLAGHLREELVKEEDTTCESCGLNLGSSSLLLIHATLVHRTADRYMETVFIEAQSREQLECILTIDSHEACDICSHMFDGSKEKKRLHYLHHLSESLLDAVPASAPFKCQEPGCQKIEYNRWRLMVHCAVVHKHIDTALGEYLNGRSEEMADKYSSWAEIPYCLVCNETHGRTTVSAKRSHYFKHFRSLVDQSICAKFGELVRKGELYHCPVSDCTYVHETKNFILMHMSFKHRLIDEFIEVAAQTVISEPPPSSSVVLDVSFIEKCKLCEQDLTKPDPKESLKLFRAHYSIHFKDRIVETFPEAFPKGQTHLSCPYDGCGFSTVGLASDQYGHHKRKLVGHLGVDHELFKHFLTEDAPSGKTLGPSSDYLRHEFCKICGEGNEVKPSMKRNHLFKHFRHVIVEQFPELSTDSKRLRCPYCEYSHEGLTKYDTVRSVSLHLGHEHGLFDKLIQDFTKKINYNSVEDCQICSESFTGRVSSKQTKKVSVQTETH